MENLNQKEIIDIHVEVSKLLPPSASTRYARLQNFTWHKHLIISVTPSRSRKEIKIPQPTFEMEKLVIVLKKMSKVVNFFFSEMFFILYVNGGI